MCLISITSITLQINFSEIYSKVAQNSVIKAEPAVIHFAGFELNKTHCIVLKLANISGDVQRMHINPPQTKYFYIQMTKNVGGIKVHRS